jgi:hypothetical protein
MILTDGGDRDGFTYAVIPRGLNNAEQRMKPVSRARHETVNGRTKNFNILKTFIGIV